jgi:hypothetical protein
MTTTLVRIHYALTACCIHVCAHARLKMLWAFEHLMLDELSSSGSRTCGLRRGNVYTYLEIEPYTTNFVADFTRCDGHYSILEYFYVIL